MPIGKVTGSVCHGQCQKPGRFPEGYPPAVLFWANNSSSTTRINYLRGGREAQKPPHPLPSLDGGWQLVDSKSREETEVAQPFLTLFMTLWVIAHQVPLSMGFPKQEYWNGLPLPSPGDLPNPGIELGSPALQADSLQSEPPGKPTDMYKNILHYIA